MNRRNFLRATVGCAVAVRSAVVTVPRKHTMTQVPPFAGGFFICSSPPISGDLMAILERSREDFNEVTL